MPLITEYGRILPKREVHGRWGKVRAATFIYETLLDDAGDEFYA
jgi:hypothetical protein